MEDKMEYEKLIQEIISLYHKARNSLYPHERIFRGESRSISSETEDLFAKYLIEFLPADIKLFINQTITTGSKEARLRVKPDIIVVRHNKIKTILDLKMDLGYKRNEFPKYWDERDALIPKMRRRLFSFFQKRGSDKSPQFLEFSEKAKLFFVIISDQNINPTQLSEVIKRQGKKRYSETYILTKGIHPNTYDISIAELMRKIEVDKESFEKLNTELQKIV
jgi:hypothetical protein